MKKTISILLAVLLLLSVVSVGATALPFAVGVAPHRVMFNRDEGPESGGFSIDYSYYSPVRTENDTTKYPLVICMAGAGEGDFPGDELESNDFALWASDEYQQQFKFSHGAFIMIPRSPDDKGYYWNSTRLIPGLKAAIRDFCTRHPNVDTDRIYGIGWCFGATGMLNLQVKYPNTFAFMNIMVMPKQISDSEAIALADTNVWLSGVKLDSFALYNTFIQPNWEKLLRFKGKGTRYFTSYNTAPTASLLFNHNIWCDASYNFCDKQIEGLSGRKTIDENGNEFDVSNYIRFISMAGTSKYYTAGNDEGSPGCVCRCHKTNPLDKLIWKIIYMIYQWLGMTEKEVCDCGISHNAPVRCETPEAVTNVTTQ